MTRAVVTGKGDVSGLDSKLKGAWPVMREKRSGVRSTDVLVEGRGSRAFPAKIGDSSFSKLNAEFTRRRLVGVDRPPNPTAVATLEALERADLTEGVALAEAAIVYGSSGGGNAAAEKRYQRLFCSGLTDVHPMTILGSGLTQLDRREKRTPFSRIRSEIGWALSRSVF